MVGRSVRQCGWLGEGCWEMREVSGWMVGRFEDGRKECDGVQWVIKGM